MSKTSLPEICDNPKSVGFEDPDSNDTITRTDSQRSDVDFRKRNSLPGNLLLNRSMSVSAFLDVTTNKRKSLPTSTPTGPLPVRRSPHQVARDGDIKAMKILLEMMGPAAGSKINELNTDKFAPLHYAARYNHYDMVKLLVEQGAVVNIRGQDGLTPLHFAARSKKGKLPKELLDYSPVDFKEFNCGKEKHPRPKQLLSPGVDLNKHRPAKNEKFNFDVKPFYNTINNEDNMTGIQFLTPDSETDSIILFLVSVGADVNCQDYNGLTPLHYTAMRGDAAAARALLKCRGINIEARDTEEMAPLHLAAIHGNIEIAELLVMSGANLRCCDDCMATPLHRASMEGNKDFVVMILEAADRRAGWIAVTEMVRDQDHEQNTALHLAVANGHREVVQYLVEKGADVNVPRQSFVCPLHLAAICGDVEIARILLSQTERIDCLNAHLETPLHLAAEHNHSALIDYLISSGANIEKREKDNCTPLLFAAKHGHVQAIETLLQHGSDLSALDKDDKNSIYWATNQNKCEALMAILNDPRFAEHVDHPDSFGNTPLHVAASKGYLEIANCLLNHGAQMELRNEDEQSPLHLAAKFGRTKIVRNFIRHKSGAIVNGEDEDGNTPLHLAALEGHENVIKVLLEVGANVEARNSHYLTPLDCAAAKGRIRAVGVLLEAECPIDPLDKNKTTPLHLAAISGSVPVVSLLLREGADVTRRDENGKTCLELAIENSQRDVALAIIESSFWLQALRCEATPLKNGQRNTPLRMLVHKMPDVAEEVLNKCMTTNKLSSEHSQYTVTFNYELVDDVPYTTIDDGEKKSIYYKNSMYTQHGNATQQNHPLMHMVQGHRLKLLGHPLCVTLLHIKWKSFGRYVYYSNLLIYLLFVIALTCYVLSTPAPNADAILLANPDANNTLENVTSDLPVNCSFANASVSGLQQSSIAFYGKHIILGLVAFHLLREFFQMYMLRLTYFGIENLMEWSCYTTTVLLVVDFTECESNTGLREPWQWEIGAMAIFLTWVNLVFFMIRKFPYLGLYVVLYVDVIKTFCKVCVIFCLIIIGYGLAFHMIMYYLDPFQSEGNSIARIIVMMLGEFQMDDLFKPGSVRYPTVSYILFISLAIVVTLLTMNLLVGLAVDEVKSAQAEAELKRLALMVDLVLNVESVLPKWIQRRFVVMEHTFMPNQENPAICERLFNIIDNMQPLREALGKGKEKKGLDKITDDQEMLNRKLSQVSNLVKQIEAKNHQMINYMTSLLKYHNVKYEEEDTFHDSNDMPRILVDRWV